MNASAQPAEQLAEHATITVQKILPAKGPNKPAWIKDTDGVSFSVWPDKLGQYREGESYEIEFVSTVSNGVTYRNIKHARAATRPGPAPSQFTSQHNQPPAARSLSSAAAQPGAGKEGGNSGSSGFYRPTSPRDAERMFVCSTMNAFIQTGRVECDEQTLINYVNALRDVWGATFGQDPN